MESTISIKQFQLSLFEFEQELDVTEKVLEDIGEKNEQTAAGIRQTSAASESAANPYGLQNGRDWGDAQLSRNENFRQVGSELAGETQSTGMGRRYPAGTLEPGNETAEIGVRYPDVGSGIGNEEISGGTRDFTTARDQYRAVNYRITDDEKIGTGGRKTKYKDNVAALKLLKELELSHRQPAPEEQSVLARYVGWGGIPQAFDRQNTEWAAEFRELSEILSPNEFASAKRSTQNAHYTSMTIIDGIYSALDRFGVKEKCRILEPSAGIGHFFGRMPENLAQTSQVMGIELDSTSAKIAQYLYPEHRILQSGFQDVGVSSNMFDLVIGNPPYGNIRVYDSYFPQLSSFTIHNYFIAKSLECVRPGGIAAVVVSRYFLDSIDSSVREHIAGQAEFLGAVRLPDNAFSENALTEVTTDLVFFKKYEEGQEKTKDWIEVVSKVCPYTQKEYEINRYFTDHPEMLLGEMQIRSGQFGDTAVLRARSGQNLALDIDEAVSRLPQNIYQSIELEKEDISDDIEVPVDLKLGAYFVMPDGSIAQKRHPILGRNLYELVSFANSKAPERVKGMIIVRDALRRLIEAEKKDHATSLELDDLRNELNSVYDRFVRDWGYISSQTNKRLMREDPEYALLSSLEVGYIRGISNETAKKHGVEARSDYAEKAPIFSRRVISPSNRITKAETAKDALIVSENQTGQIDLDLMKRLYKKEIPEILKELDGLIYLNPETMRFERREKYLSGNVKAKLQYAKLIAKSNPEFERNILALEGVQPPDIDPIDIAVQIGSSWVPADVYKEFIRQLLSINANHVDSINLFYHAALGKWTAEIPSWLPYRSLQTTYGTEKYPATEILKSLFEGRELRVMKEVGRDENGRKISEVDAEATTIVKEKAAQIEQAFLDWVWDDHDRRVRLSRIYNDTFNTHVAPSYDGSHLQLPGLALDIALRPHQKNAIWRALQEGNTLFDHTVGAGKTMVCIATAMEAKRIGLLKKPMFVVPNHLLTQWKDEFYRIYPSANILTAGKKDFEKNAREKLFSQIATGDWDAVIVAHSSFKKIGLPFESHMEIMQEQLDDLTAALDGIKDVRGSNRSVKQLEAQRANVEAKLKRISDTGKKDRSVDFADLGVDALFVDEFQEFKNLFIHTGMRNVAGLGNIKGSDKAYDMFVKIRHLQKQNDGKGVFTATGTPISNTIAEVFTLMRYHQYDLLKEKNIMQFDAWAKTFGQVVTGWELDATGSNYRINSRFNKFQNMPELVSLYRSFSDVIKKQDLIRQNEELGKKFPIPKIKGGRPANIVIPRSEAQARFIGEQDPKTQEWTEGSIIWRMENMPKDPSIDNPLKVTNEARLVALDPRLVIEKAAVNENFSWGETDPYFDSQNGKTNVVAREIYRIYEKWHDEKGTQLVFCDLSTPKNFRGNNSFTLTDDNIEENDQENDIINNDDSLTLGIAFSVYDDLKQKLIGMGIPEDEIRFIHEADSDVKKAQLFEKMNNGDVRVLLGSTTKMGAGTNVQKRLVALHHIDAPWRPSDLEQREGRILRQGNELYEQDPDGFEVEIFRYATEKTYDARMWQTIENKAIGIEQFGKGDASVRIIDDVTGESANSAEMKAMATGNPLILKQVQLADELKKLETLKRGHDRSKYYLEESINRLQNAEKIRDETIANLKAAIQIRDENTSKEKVIYCHGREFGLNEADQFGIFLQKALASYNRYRGSVLIGNYRGFDVRVKPSFSVSGFEFEYNRCGMEITPGNLLYRDNDPFSMTGFLQRWDNIFNSFEENIKDAQIRCENQLAELEKAKIEVQKPFAQLEHLEYLRKDNAQILVELKKMQEEPDYVSFWVPLTEGGIKEAEKKHQVLNENRKAFYAHSR